MNPPYPDPQLLIFVDTLYKTVSFTNIKLPHFPNIFRSILNSFYFKIILKINFGSEAFAV